MWLSMHSDSAVESITLRPRSSASRCGELGQELGAAVLRSGSAL